ncbi:MAG: SRPBCC family protein [Deltaproteobacteria bacterium]|nr:SRPBCC family protein [Deltaproteobacteria bacterium]
MSKHSIVHSTFTVERTYPATAARVFNAFTDPVKKRRWFGESEGFVIETFTVDVREGGHEVSTFRFQGGPLMRNDTVYQDIVENQRLVFVYSMVVGDKRISSSLASVELFPEGKSTRLVYTEQGQFFDGIEEPKQRQLGCDELMGRLADELAHHS